MKLWAIKMLFAWRWRLGYWSWDAFSRRMERKAVARPRRWATRGAKVDGRLAQGRHNRRGSLGR